MSPSPWLPGMLVSWTLDADDEPIHIRLVADASTCHDSGHPVWTAVSLAGEMNDYELTPGLCTPCVDDFSTRAILAAQAQAGAPVGLHIGVDHGNGPDRAVVTVLQAETPNATEVTLDTVLADLQAAQEKAAAQVRAATEELRRIVRKWRR